MLWVLHSECIETAVNTGSSPSILSIPVL